MGTPFILKSSYLAALTGLVQYGVGHQHLSRYVFIKDTIDQRWQRHKGHVLHCQVEAVNHQGARETAEDLEPEEDKYRQLKSEQAEQAMSITTKIQPHKKTKKQKENDGAGNDDKNATATACIIRMMTMMMTVKLLNVV